MVAELEQRLINEAGAQIGREARLQERITALKKARSVD